MSATEYVIVDESDAPELAGKLVTMAADIQCAYDVDFAPAHAVLPVSIFVRHPSEVQDGQRVLHIVATIEGEAPGALAYHTVDAKGNPVLRLGVAEHRKLGGNLLDVLSESLSHEIFETAHNPFCVRYVQGPWPGKLVADEVCDPVQGSPYRSGSTLIANFVLPAWSDAEDTEGPYDFVTQSKGQRILTKPFDCYPSGYLAFNDGSQAFGDKVPEAKQEQAHHARVAYALSKAA